jgi:hypothetical protein
MHPCIRPGMSLGEMIIVASAPAPGRDAAIMTSKNIAHPLERLEDHLLPVNEEPLVSRYDFAFSFLYRAQRFFCAAAMRFRAAVDSPFFAGLAEGAGTWPLSRVRMSSIAFVSRPASI